MKTTRESEWEMLYGSCKFFERDIIFFKQETKEKDSFAVHLFLSYFIFSVRHRHPRPIELLFPEESEVYWIHINRIMFLVNLDSSPLFTANCF